MLAGNKGGYAGYRIEIGRHDVGIGNRNAETLLKERHQLEDAGGIHKIVFDQRKLVAGCMVRVAEQEVLDDEGADLAR